MSLPPPPPAEIPTQPLAPQRRAGGGVAFRTADRNRSRCVRKGTGTESAALADDDDLLLRPSSTTLHPRSFAADPSPGQAKTQGPEGV